MRLDLGRLPRWTMGVVPVLLAVALAEMQMRPLRLPRPMLEVELEPLVMMGVVPSLLQRSMCLLLSEAGRRRAVVESQRWRSCAAEGLVEVVAVRLADSG